MSDNYLPLWIVNQDEQTTCMSCVVYLSLQIVDHRVDRMYFMSGNSIKLKPRYDVDDDELTRMKEMQAKNKETAYKRQDICLIKMKVFV